MKLVW